MRDGGGVGGGKLGFGRFNGAPERNLGTRGGRAVEGSAAERGVDLVAASPLEDIGDRKTVDPASGQNLDAAAGVTDVLGNVGGAIVSAGLLAGRHDARDAEIDELIKRDDWIADHVEGAMENNLTSASESDDLATAFDVDKAGSGENSKCNSGSAFGERCLSVLLHDFEFAAAVAKTSGAWANSTGSCCGPPPS